MVMASDWGLEGGEFEKWGFFYAPNLPLDRNNFWHQIKEP